MARSSGRVASRGAWVENASITIGLTGAVSGTKWGISVDGAGTRVTNLGVVSGDVGVSLGQNAAVVNHGTISGTTVAIDAKAGIDLFNSGTITSPKAAIASSCHNLADRAVNAGLIRGRISLCDGDDVHDGADGRVYGRVNPGSGNDVALGGLLADAFDDGLGEEEIDAGGGKDTIFVSNDKAADTTDGGAGIDLRRFSLSGDVTVDFNRGIAPSAATGSDLIEGFEQAITGSGADRITGDATDNLFRSGQGDDSLCGGAGKDRLLGGAGKDHLFGGAGVDLLDGGAGKDRLFGGVGRDDIAGGAGNDIIHGGRDTDLMSGGPGADRFVRRDVNELSVVASNLNFDRITDLVPGEDRIDLSQIDPNGTGPDDAFVFRGTAGINGPGQVAIRLAGGSTDVDISWLTAGVDGSIQLTGTLTLTADDFHLQRSAGPVLRPRRGRRSRQNRDPDDREDRRDCGRCGAACRDSGKRRAGREPSCRCGPDAGQGDQGAPAPDQVRRHDGAGMHRARRPRAWATGNRAAPGVGRVAFVLMHARSDLLLAQVREAQNPFPLSREVL